MLLDVNVADGLLIAGGTERVGLTGALLLEELFDRAVAEIATFDEGFDVVVETPLKAGCEHAHSAGHVPLAGTQEAEEDTVRVVHLDELPERALETVRTVRVEQSVEAGLLFLPLGFLLGGVPLGDACLLWVLVRLVREGITSSASGVALSLGAPIKVAVPHLAQLLLLVVGELTGRTVGDVDLVLLDLFSVIGAKTDKLLASATRLLGRRGSRGRGSVFLSWRRGVDVVILVLVLGVQLLERSAHGSGGTADRSGCLLGLGFLFVVVDGIMARLLLSRRRSGLFDFLPRGSLSL